MVGMTNFLPLSAAHLSNFFDASGRPLGASSKCPTCNRTIRFDLHSSNGKIMQFTGHCGHAFEVPTPK